MNHLSKQEAENVIRLLSALFLYAYKTKNKKVKITMESMEHVCHMGSEILFRNEHSSIRLIDSYMKQHPELSKEDIACISRFKGCCKRRLYVMRYEDEYTIVMDRISRDLYRVKGITDSLELLLRNQTLPCVVEYAVLPYKDFFILDSIGNTQAITDFSLIIELYEEFRSIAVEKGVKRSLSEVDFIQISERNMQVSAQELFYDYFIPMNSIWLANGKQNQDSILELALNAWNLSYGSDEQAMEFFSKELFKKYVKPLMDYRRTAFSDVRFLIDRLEPPQERESFMQVVVKKDMEYTELKLDV